MIEKLKWDEQPEDAAKAMGLKSTSGIRYCLQGVYKTSGGHKWVKTALEQKD